MLLSTRISTTLPSSHGHDFIRGQFYFSFAPHMRNETIPPALPIFDFSNPHTVSNHIEGHFGVLKQPQLLTNCLRDRHLSFLGDSHGFPLSPVLLLPLIVLPARGSVNDDIWLLDSERRDNPVVK